ncbi:class I SAM-dependent methyltransferase [Singulisphaera sp. PoT]|uniref:class I SAM-dependent methyltransferase n=1 Tax=Singulisphaera sp. PoT TaxID=3411797 RepID=UPI003BF47EBE
MTTSIAHEYEAEVAARFDELQARFKRVVPDDDARLRALVSTLEPLRGKRILDLGCGKGRFASRLAEGGAEVVGIDLSAGMLEEAEGLNRVRCSASRLPFASASFDAVVAVEVFEHLEAIDPALSEARRVLRDGGILAIVDKNAASLNAHRPWLPSLAVKWIDQRRGRWMYRHDERVRERWFWPRRLSIRLRRDFEDVSVRYLLSPNEADRWVFRQFPAARLMTVWSAKVAVAGRAA